MAWVDEWRRGMALAYDAGLADGLAGKASLEGAYEFEAAYRQGYDHGERERLQEEARQEEARQDMDAALRVGWMRPTDEHLARLADAFCEALIRDARGGDEEARKALLDGYADGIEEGR